MVKLFVRLFISYASEDESDFAEPLANELSKDNEVWFAPYKLKVGDSLFEKINEGLRTCDYGVVILSHHFFAKKWPTAELNGLFALEEPFRKLILPVWRGLTADDIKIYSPILADRKAADGSTVASAAADLRFALSASDRQRVLSALDKSVRGLVTLTEALHERQNSERLLTNEEGRALVVTATGQLFDTIETAINALVSSSAPALRFQCKRDSAKFVRVDASYQLSLHLSLHLPYTNSAGNCRLRVGVYRDDDRFGHASGTLSAKWTNLSAEEYLPFIRLTGEVMWKRNADEVITGDQLAAKALESLRAALEQAAL